MCVPGEQEQQSMVFGSLQVALGPEREMFEANLGGAIPVFTVPCFGSKVSGLLPFGLPAPSKRPLLSVASGESVNCDELRIIPHAHCTHLESGSHIAANGKFPPPPVTINAPKLAIVLNACDLDGPKDDEVEVVLVRKPFHSTQDPTGLHHEQADMISARFPSASVVGINEASFDAEDDRRLLFHRRWFAAAADRFLLELVDLSDDSLHHNGRYLCLLNVQLLRDTDAFPACPILYPIERVLIPVE